VIVRTKEEIRPSTPFGNSGQKNTKKKKERKKEKGKKRKERERNSHAATSLLFLPTNSQRIVLFSSIRLLSPCSFCRIVHCLGSCGSFFLDCLEW